MGAASNDAIKALPKRGNVLVIGSSGVGKSTLINAVLGEDVAHTSWGKAGTKELEIYGDENAPFRLIDTIGFEPSSKRQREAVNAVKGWSKDCAKKGHEDNQINLIWFCIDGTSARLFKEIIGKLNEATDMWKTVPVIAVITKSYSEYEQQDNVRMVREAFEQDEEAAFLQLPFIGKKSYSHRLRKIIPVVAKAWKQSDEVIVAPRGIDTLIETTMQLMPEGLVAGGKDLSDFVLMRKRAFAQSVVGVSVASGAAIGFAALPFADAALLIPVETAEVTAISKIFGLKKDDEYNMLIDTIIEAGTISVAAKTAISTLRTIPGINVAASVVNAVVAGTIIAALGEGCTYLFEQISLGKMSETDLDSVNAYLEGILENQEILKSISEMLKSFKGGADIPTIAKAITDLFIKRSNNAE